MVEEANSPSLTLSSALRRRLEVEKLHLQREEEVRNVGELAVLRRHVQFLNHLLQKSREDMRKADEENALLREQLVRAADLSSAYTHKTNTVYESSITAAFQRSNPPVPFFAGDSVPAVDDNAFQSHCSCGWTDLARQELIQQNRDGSSSGKSLQAHDCEASSNSRVADLLDRSDVALKAMRHLLSDSREQLPSKGSRRRNAW